jgi:hypothetical protein
MEPPGGWSPAERVMIAEGERRAAEAEGWVALRAPEARVCAEAVRLACDVARKNATDLHKSEAEQTAWRHRESVLWTLISRLEGRL